MSIKREGNYWVKQLALGHFSSTNQAIRIDTYRSDYDGAPWNKFDFTLTDDLRRGDVYEVTLQNIVTNWLPQSNFIPNYITITVQLVSFPAIYGIYGFPLKLGGGALLYSGNSPSFQNDQVCYNIFVDFPGWTTNNIQLEIILFPGLNLTNQYLSTQVLGNLIEQQANLNVTQTAWNTYNSFYASSSSLIQTSFYESNYGCSWINASTTENWGIPLGQIESSTGVLGLKMAGFQPFSIAVPSASNYNMPAYVPAFFGCYYFGFIDLLNETAFNYYVGTNNNYYIKTNPELVTLARLLGFPHDILYPAEFKNMCDSSLSIISENLVLNNVTNNPASISVSNSSINLSGDYNKPYTSISYLIRYSDAGSYLESVSENWQAIVTNLIMTINSPYETPPLNINTTPKVLQINANNVNLNSFNNNQSNIPLNTYIEGLEDFNIFTRVFYDGENNNQLWYNQREMISPIYVPDYYMESKYLNFVIYNDQNQLERFGGTCYNGIETDIFQSCITLNTNPYGAYQNEVIQVPSWSNNLILQSSHSTSNNTTTIYQVTLSTISELCNIYSVPNFIPISLSPQNTLGQLTTITISTKQDTVTNLTFEVLDSLNQTPLNIFSISNITPYTQATLAIKVFANPQGVQDNTLLARPGNYLSLYSVDRTHSIARLPPRKRRRNV